MVRIIMDELGAIQHSIWGHEYTFLTTPYGILNGASGRAYEPGIYILTTPILIKMVWVEKR